MTDYTPTTQTVRDVYATAVGIPEAPKRQEWFDSWLTAHDAQVRREAKAEALLALASTPVAQHHKSKAWLHHAGCTISLHIWLISEAYKIGQEGNDD